jgi:hypothetical protein
VRWGGRGGCHGDAQARDHEIVEYLDLTPYVYTDSALPMTAVGWLGDEHGVQGGTATPLTDTELRMLQAASRRASNPMLGYHECEFCSVVRGNGEFRCYLPGGAIYAAPTMIVHYVVRHGYRLPVELLSGVSEAVRPRWDWRAERLRSILLDESADYSWRANAAADLGRWGDPRAHEALWSAVQDEELVDCAGDVVGRSLVSFAGRDYARDLAGEDLHPMVRFGIEKASWVDYRIFIQTVARQRA